MVIIFDGRESHNLPASQGIIWTVR